MKKISGDVHAWYLRIKTVCTLSLGLACYVFAGSAITQQRQLPVNVSILDEIVVTATKRDTLAQQTAVSMTVLDQAELEYAGILDFSSYLDGVPGIALNDEGIGFLKVTIRGISTGGVDTSEKSTTALYFGEAPVSYGVAGQPDLKLIDMERIEVLRGPKGTLYGASSMGGTLRMIPKAPVFNQFEGWAKLGASSFSGSDDPNYNLTGALNIPLIEDTLALRAVVYQYDEAGYFDNEFSGISLPFNPQPMPPVIQPNQNELDLTGYRVSAHWAPTYDLDISLTVVDQNLFLEGYDRVDIIDIQGLSSGVGWIDLKYDGRPYSLFKNYDLDESMAEDDIALLNTVIEYDFGFMSMLYSGSTLQHRLDFVDDHSAAIEWLYSRKLFYLADNDAITHELRFVSNNDQSRWHWLAGYFYSRDKNRLALDFRVFGENAQFWTGLPDGSTSFLRDDFNTDTQHAIFGEVSYAIAQDWSLTMGARAFTYDNQLRRVTSGTVQGVTGEEFRKVHDTDINLSFNLAFQATPDSLLYASASEGFRGGIANALNETDGAVTRSCLDEIAPFGITENQALGTEPDSIWTFELGTKHTTPSGRIRANGALFYSAWQDVQIRSTEVSCWPFFNVGDARSFGGELELVAQLAERTQLSVGASYVDSKLTDVQDNLQALFPQGEEFLAIPKWNLDVSVQHGFQIAGTDAWARAQYTLVGSADTTFAGGSEPIGDYGVLDLRAGLEFGDWWLNLYVENATGEYGLTGNFPLQDLITGDPNAHQLAIPLRPRHVGMSVGFQF